jgi:hypothetical protein
MVDTYSRPGICDQCHEPGDLKSVNLRTDSPRRWYKPEVVLLCGKCRKLNPNGYRLASTVDVEQELRRREVKA